MAPRIHVIADDLTGAADTGVAFAQAGLATRLLVAGAPASTPADAVEVSTTTSATDVLVHDTGSRDATASEAAESAARVARELPGGATVLKKIDSLLRGHPADETRALRKQLRPQLVVVAPAFPSLGRTTLGGIAHVGGAALHDTELWALEQAPAPRSVGEVLPGVHVPLALVRAAPEALTARLAEIANGGDPAVCDAVTDDDLDRIVAGGRAAAEQLLWVGAGGLGAALARALGSGRALHAVRPSGRFLAVVGSADPVARQQTHELARLGVRVLEVEAERLADPAYAAATAATATEAAGAGDLVVQLSSPVRSDRREAVAQALAACVAEAARAASTLALVGGATAHAVLRARGVRSLTLTGQAEPGVVLGVPDDNPSSSVLTKAGSFGDPGTLARVLVEASATETATPQQSSRKAAT
jgi:uncharacterized protein YgbK (DUF1537 family)